MSFRTDDPRLIDHPVTFIHEWQAIAIPARVHADGVPFGKSRINAEVANISSPLATGDTLDTLNLWFLDAEGVNHEGYNSVRVRLIQ